MQPERWQQVKTLVAGALEQPDAAARGAYLSVHCGDGNTTLRLEVESLLAQTTDSIEACAGGGSRVAPTADDAKTDSTIDPNIGRRIGVWRLGERLGVGGMGAVYLARRVGGAFDQTAALKLLKRGTDTEEVLRRFRAERQILARLEHPNIARLLDGGETDDGLPYFVLEHVAGTPLTTFSRAAELSVPARLELFRKVCAAVQFAHQNLVIHRDLKPGNILVTAEGEPKLLDFGIAKLLEEDGDSGQTLLGHGRLTPAYASPEQARGEPVTTASDIYSLGVLLYELLTGLPAHRSSNPRSSSPVELLRVVAHTEPSRPSQAVSDPALRRRLRGDLDNIVLRAMAREPARRYPSASDLADDLRRHAENRPVRARPDTFGYRTAKFVERNKLGVAVGVVVLLTLLGSMVAVTAQRNRAEKERRRAEASEYRSRRQLYAAQMNLAFQAWESTNVGRALDLLEAERPKRGQEDLRGFEWHLLWRLTHERWRILYGPAEATTNAIFSPDGRQVAAVAEGRGKALVWDVDTGRLLQSCETGSENVAFTPDGQGLFTGAADGSARLWDVASGRLVRTFAGHSAGIRFVAISPDGQTLATVSHDGRIKLWNVESGQERATLPGHGGVTIQGMNFSPDGRTLATASQDHTAKLWDTASGQEIATLRGHSWYVNDAAFSPDGRTLATTGSDGEIKLWDTTSHRETGTIHGDGSTIEQVRFSPDGRWLAAAAADNTVRIFDTASGKRADTLRGHTGPVFSDAFSPDGRTLVSVGADRTVRLWDLTRSPGARRWEAHTDWISSIAFSPDGRILASASKDATVKLWDTVAGRELMTLRHPQWVNGCAFSPDGSRLATADDDALVRLWNPQTGENTATLGGHQVVVECVVFSPDGETLASGGKNGEIKLWATATGREIATFHSPNPDLVWSLAFSPDGERLAVAEGDALSHSRPHAVTVWDVSARRVIATLPGHTNDVRAVAFSRDGTVLASGSWDGTIKLWNVAAQREIVTLKVQRSVHSLDFSADGKRLVSAGSDKTVKIWDLTVHQELCTLTGNSEVTAVAFSPDNRTLAAGSRDGVVRLWVAAAKKDGELPAK